MDQGLQEYYEECISTTNSKGWDYLVQDAIADRAMLDNVMSIKDAEHLHRTQGRIRELDAFIGQKGAIRASYEKLIAEEKAIAEGRDPNDEEPEVSEAIVL